MNLQEFHKRSLFIELVNTVRDPAIAPNILEEIGFSPIHFPRNMPPDRLGDWTSFWRDVCNSIEAGVLHQGKDFSPLVNSVHRSYPANALFGQNAKQNVKHVIAPQGLKPIPDGVNFVFISYSREDSAAIDELRKHFEAAKIEIWLDIEDMPPGANVTDAIQEKISESKGVLIFLGRKPVDRWQKREMDLALGEHIETNKPIFPVCLFEDMDIQMVPKSLHPNNILWMPRDLKRLLKELQNLVANG